MWNYMTVDVDNDNWMTTTEVLNARGADGWELVAAVRLWDGRPVLTYVFKRPAG